MIRPLAPADVPQVAALEAALFAGSAWSADAWAQEAAAGDPDRRYFVAEQEGLVGYAGILRAGSDADVLTVAVSPDHQGRGLGGRLLDTLLDFARGWNCLAVFLEVEPDNASAVALYRGRGFVDIGQRRNYYGTGRHALTMRLQLREPLGSRLLDGAL